MKVIFILGFIYGYIYLARSLYTGEITPPRHKTIYRFERPTAYWCHVIGFALSLTAFVVYFWVDK